MPYTGTVAVVGIGGIFPDAPDLERFWDNIRSGRSAAREVPEGRWSVPAGDVYSPEVGAVDHVYSRRGCFIEELPPFTPSPESALKPEHVTGLDPLFHLLLHAGKRAFDDGVTAPLDRSRVGVIIGNLALPSEGAALLARQTLGRSFAEKLLGRSVDYGAANPLNRYVAGLPAGLLAQSLGLGGGAFTLDAACASSLYAIKLAADELLSGRCDAMLSGGLSRPDPLYTQMGFSQLRALSRRGICSPFDAAGDGLVVGEGAGLFLLKRTEDAQAHGDRIYGVIRAIGLANDVGGSLLAPLSEGQLRAMRAAYEKAGWTPRDVELIECHATGTPVGDAVEVASLKELWREDSSGDERCVIGSVKSNIGHLLTAAGAAALTKVLLAMKAGTLPPTAGFTIPQPRMALEQSPFRVLTAEEPWLRRGDGIPRRAAVSAFGFGGINAHLLVEEWLPTAAASFHPPFQGEGQDGDGIAIVGMDARFGPWQSLRAFQERVLGGRENDSPLPPRRWWGAESSDWFREKGMSNTPFSGFYQDEVAVTAEQFRIPPRELEEMLPQQLLMLQTAAAAMADAGSGREENLRTGLFIGIALDLNSTNFSHRWSLAGEAASWSAELELNLTPAELADWTSQLRDAAGPPLTANRTMGALGSVVASRIAREFKVGGPSFTISSEESSGISSLATAVSLLRQGEIDQALVGAVDLAGDLRASLGHHALRPYSSDGTPLPFSTLADGSLTGEGAAAVVLKRLTDAERDGDRIYAVIKGIGVASGGLVTPDETTYNLALRRAYDEAGVSPGTITSIEAHAPGHPASDRMEAAALASFFGTEKSLPRFCAVSSLAGEIGHVGAAAGLASLVRACLSLYQELIPPCRGAASPLPQFAGNSTLFLPATPRYWLRNRVEGPRRAGVSVFGVDGNCSHLILEGWDQDHPRNREERLAPVGRGEECLFVLTGESPAELSRELGLLRRDLGGEADLAGLARKWYELSQEKQGKKDAPAALALVARSGEELTALLNLGEEALTAGEVPTAHPALRDRLFYTTTPLGHEAKIAFVFPGSGNHYPGMGAELSARWPELFRRQDKENRFLRSQFQPELFWNGAPQGLLDADSRAVILGQVTVGCAVSDVIRIFGVTPQGVIGYSLGESAGLLALSAWRDRDGMRQRMEESTLFTHDLAGECRAARRAWGMAEDEQVVWNIGVVDVPAQRVRAALHAFPRVYLLIVNTPDECVVGGDAGGVRQLVALLECRFFPLSGITTVHCQVAQEVAEAYRSLHLFPTTPPEGVAFYSGAWGHAYRPDRERAADAILAQAVEGIDYPAVINSAYNDGVRLFLEMGPGSSCSRMIGRILDGRPHRARPVVTSGQEPVSATLRLLAQLASERVTLDLSSLYEITPVITASTSLHLIRVITGGSPYVLPPLPKRTPVEAVLPSPAGGGQDVEDSIIRDFAAAQEARISAHAAYLQTAGMLTSVMASALSFEASLIAALGGDPFSHHQPSSRELPQKEGQKKSIAFDRGMCLEFARGSVARMLGPEFAPVDSYPTRVRLPDEPLMLVDRIISVEGEARSMTSGRVVTEHDIHPGAWYLDGGRIPTCVAVEAGQADLFLSGYLGIDFITKGIAVYRLLDAVVTFHRGLPGPGDIISYDIRIERFFRQGETHLFRFFFEATVNGEPLLSMRDGCAGFFTAGELAAGKGIVKPLLELRAESGITSGKWQELVPVARERYDARQVDCLRSGNLAGCFGDLFASLPVTHPLTIPGGRMQLVHRVTDLDPAGGRYGLGFIRAEADIHPDDWFITCHFVDDKVMPGTLMYECCLHTLRIFLLRMGWVAESPGAAWEPVPGIASRLCCRGQVLATTKIVTYEVTVRQVGYKPEPYAVVDALMYADGKPIVEITSMSVRLTGTTEDQLRTLWRKHGTHPHPTPPLEGEGASTFLPFQGGGQEGDGLKPALYTKEQILAYSNGNPSEGFGEPYRIFDQERKIARLPGPPFQFMDRVTAVGGEPWQMQAGALAEAQYTVPAGAWYFSADRQPRMPFSILLEAALQPCGWLAAYVGSALTSPADLSFRNLGGSGILHRPVTPESGVLTATATLTKAAASGGMIIQEFTFSVADRQGVLYKGETMFGFFSREALANQVGIRDAKPYAPTRAENERGRTFPFPTDAPFPERQLRMIDTVELFVADGGPAGLGYIRGIKEVDPDEWFFKAHFYQDPVTPGSLGLEAFLQLLKFTAVERWGWKQGELLVAMVPGQRHRWLYRGQIVPTNSRVTVEAWITAVDEQNRTLTANGFLSVDGKLIYQMNDFTLKMDGQR